MMEMESPRRSASPPEFEFWMLGNTHPQLEPSALLTADELFADGVLLPLRLLSIHPDPNPEPKPAAPGFGSGTPEPLPPPSKQERRGEEAAASASICRESSICSSNSTPLTSSKRWKDIFKVGEKKKESVDEKEKRERKASNGGGGGGGSGGGAAELNINIWPFSRSRSAGTAAGGRPKAAAMRKSSSAPCSRSNSRGENSGGRRWAASPGRPGAGVHVGRASPVWQVRRAGKGAEAGAGRAGKVSRAKGGNRGLGLNVNSCIGYRSQLSCRSDDYDEKRGASNANGSLSKIRALFSKKVY